MVRNEADFLKMKSTFLLNVGVRRKSVPLPVGAGGIVRTRQEREAFPDPGALRVRMQEVLAVS